MESDLKQNLVPPRPPTPPRDSKVSNPLVTSLRPPIPPVSGGRSIPPGSDFSMLKKIGQGVRSWISIDWKGQSKVMEADKVTIMRRCSLPARDLRLLDPLFVYPSTILGREKAIVVNLEQIRCVITADECLLLNIADPVVQEYKNELVRRIISKDLASNSEPQTFSPRGTGAIMTRAKSEYLNGSEKGSADIFSGFGGVMSEDQPFEFKCLEVALESACSFLDSQASALTKEAYPLLERLAYQVSKRNLELVRRVKSNLVALTRRVEKVRLEIEQLMDDDGDMAEMYLTQKRLKQEASFHYPGGNAFGSYTGPNAGEDPQTRSSLSAPVSPKKEDSRAALSQFDRDSVFGSHFQLGSDHSKAESESEEENIEQLEMLLEAYFVVIDGTLNKLAQLSQYIDDTEDFINIQLDNVRNQLIQFELLLTTATFVVTIYGVVAGVFGMNVPLGVEENPYAFQWILWLTGIGGMLIFGAFLMYFRFKNLTIV